VVFNSFAFPVFLAVAFLAYLACPVRWRAACLLVLSLGFYALWSLPHLGLLIAATGVAWVFARRVAATEDESARQRNVFAGVLILLGVLVAFKYGTTAVRSAGFQGLLDYAVPVGISYYTFKLIGYLVDTHWGKVKTAHGFSGLLRYAAFFPQILSGPIQRADDYLSQQKGQPGPNVRLASSALRLILFGFFKKLVVADRAAILVDQVYARPAAFPAITVWLICYLYAIQLYADFSGFTDIAIGVGRLFGIRSPKNFDSPYYAPNIQEFWRRWHMSLTSWLTDYVFTPLRMATRNWGQLGLVASIVINMLAIGIWHGPSWTFVLFGAINAVYVVFSALTLKRRNKWFARYPRLASARAVAGPLVVFHLMVIAFIPFRASTISDAWLVFTSFANGFVELPALLLGVLTRSAPSFGPLETWSSVHTVLLLGSVCLMEALHLLQSRGGGARAVEARPRVIRWAAYYALALAIVLFARPGQQASIYFRF
jgi:alginate O-acetyltransferase complex protein AlgI